MSHIPAEAGRSVNFLVQFKRLDGDISIACPTKQIRARATGRSSGSGSRHGAVTGRSGIRGFATPPKGPNKSPICPFPFPLSYSNHWLFA